MVRKMSNSYTGSDFVFSRFQLQQITTNAGQKKYVWFPVTWPSRKSTQVGSMVFVFSFLEVRLRSLSQRLYLAGQ